MGQPLPVIVSFGGVNSAGRASMHHGTARLLHEALPSARREQTLVALRQLVGRASASEDELLERTLIRRIEAAHFDVDHVAWNRRLPTQGDLRPVSFDLQRRHLPEPLPEHWRVTDSELDDHVNVQIAGRQEFLLPTHRDFEVKAASQLPRGFDPAVLYASRNHPRGLAMAVYAASDALGNLGLDWDALMARLAPDQVSVYAGSAMGQLDDNGTGGMLKARYRGGRVTSKNCPLGLAQMPADFMNAYVLGSAGATGASLGACASFLYNLRLAVQDIRAGRARVAVVAAAESPITPEVMEGYAAMGALASDKGCGSSTVLRRAIRRTTGAPVVPLGRTAASPSPNRRRRWCFSTTRWCWRPAPRCSALLPTSSLMPMATRSRFPAPGWATTSPLPAPQPVPGQSSATGRWLTEASCRRTVPGPRRTALPNR
jgi:acetoacetyl-[acyl-carrier protein] synthase